MKKAHELGSWAFDDFNFAAYCDEAGGPAGVPVAGATGADDDELGKMFAEVECDDLEPRALVLTLVVPRAAGR